MKTDSPLLYLYFWGTEHPVFQDAEGGFWALMDRARISHGG